MNAEDKKRLEKFRDQVSVPLINTDPAKWPIRSGRIGHIVLDMFSSEFIKDVEELKRRGMTIQQIGKLFHNPTRLWRMSHHFLSGLKMAGYSLDEQRKHILTLLDMIGSLKYESEFIDDGKNLILSPDEVEIIKKGGLQKSKIEDSHLIHKLAGLLWTYTETLYFVAHEISVEIHGPYKYDSSNVIIVRDYFGLKPSELWPDCQNMPYNNIRIIGVYEDLLVDFDVYNNPYLKKGRYVDTLNLYHMEADEHPIEVSDILRLSNEISNTVRSVTQKVTQWPLLDIAKKYANIFGTGKSHCVMRWGKVGNHPKR